MMKKINNNNNQSINNVELKTLDNKFINNDDVMKKINMLKDEMTTKDPDNFITNYREYKQYTDDDNIVINSEIRNVLLVGRTKSGKTTLRYNLRNPYIVGMIQTLFSTTIKANCETYSVKIQNKHYTYNIIDTPGLYERTIDNNNRTDEELMNIIFECVSSNMVNLHCVYFVITRSLNYPDYELEILKKLKEYFPPLYNKVKIILTNCEKTNINTLNNNKKELSKVLNMEENKIFFSGGLHHSELEDDEDKNIIIDKKNIN